MNTLEKAAAFDELVMLEKAAAFDELLKEAGLYPGTDPVKVMDGVSPAKVPAMFKAQPVASPVDAETAEMFGNASRLERIEASKGPTRTPEQIRADNAKLSASHKEKVRAAEQARVVENVNRGIAEGGVPAGMRGARPLSKIDEAVVRSKAKAGRPVQGPNWSQKVPTKIDKAVALASKHKGKLGLAAAGVTAVAGGAYLMGHHTDQQKAAMFDEYVMLEKAAAFDAYVEQTQAQ